MSFNDKETSPLSSTATLLPQYTSDLSTPTEPRYSSQPPPLTPLRILKGILNLSPRLFPYFCVLHAALTVFWCVNNPNTMTTAPFTSIPMSAKQLANTVLVAWLMGWVKVYLSFIRRTVYRQMWQEQF